MKLIEDEIHLSELCRVLRNTEYICIDTEFLRYKTFFPKVCLIQIAFDNKIVVIDTLKVVNLDNLIEVIYNQKITWIVHAARNDIESLFQFSKQVPSKVFDTQIAAKIVGLGEQISYNDLVKDQFSTILDKKYTRYPWDKRPIPKEVLNYAVDDVRFLEALHRNLQNKISQNCLAEKFNQETLKILDKDLYEYPNDQAWQKIKAKLHLKSTQKNKIQQLASIRENYAKKKNIPRQWIFTNKELFLYAKEEKQMDKKLYNKLIDNFE